MRISRYQSSLVVNLIYYFFYIRKMGLKEFIDSCPLNEYKYEEILLGDKLGEGGQAPVNRCKIGDREYASKV